VMLGSEGGGGGDKDTEMEQTISLLSFSVCHSNCRIVMNSYNSTVNLLSNDMVDLAI
jgi:hypothetical protein